MTNATLSVVAPATKRKRPGRRGIAGVRLAGKGTSSTRSDQGTLAMIRYCV